MTAWKDYQRDARDLFRELGMTADNDVTVTGVRTTHAIDVLVDFEHVGLSLRWLVECKFWKERVSKLHVLGLRAIVDDVGADRGILLSERGFQSGAIEAAASTNITLTTLAALRADAKRHFLQAHLNSFPKRLEYLRARYWSVPKSEREERGLRPEGPASGYEGGSVLMITADVVVSALANSLPPGGTFGSQFLSVFDKEIEDQSDAADWIETVLDDLEARLDDVTRQPRVGLLTMFDRIRYNPSE
jgi:restriction system protein